MQPAMEIGSWDLMKKLVAKGMGIGVIPREYCKRQLEMGELFEVTTDPLLPVRSVGMVHAKDAPMSYALHSFIDIIQKQDK